MHPEASIKICIGNMYGFKCNLEKMQDWIFKDELEGRVQFEVFDKLTSHKRFSNCKRKHTITYLIMCIKNIQQQIHVYLHARDMRNE